MIKLTSKTYTVQDGWHRWRFEINDTGVSIPGLYNENLLFKNSKLKKLKSFYKAIGEFLSTIEEKWSENTLSDEQLSS